VAYDGSAYFGWQRQLELPTVQESLELALSQVTGDARVKAYASSRTDTGVHAIGQSVAFRTSAWLAPAERLPFALNTKLPSDIVAREAIEVPLSFHPLRDSRSKRYRYLVYSSRKADPIHARTHWWIRRRASLESMREAAELLVGRHDFFSFQSAGSPRQTTVRHVQRISLESSPHMDGHLIAIEIEADGFLYNMVRNIVGTLVQVGVGRERPAWVANVLAAKDRRVAGATAPAHGLCLLEVKY
jgi:tRNA pseudouridine38-40 synthase